MPLFKEVEPDQFEQWLGEPINGIPYPTNIEDMWSYESLASIGLYRPQEPLPIPEGYRVLSTRPKRDVDGYVRYVHELEAIDPIPISSEEINKESSRRIEDGFFFNFKKFDNDPKSSDRISGASTLALIAIFGGAQPGNLYWHYPSSTWDLPQQEKEDLEMTPFIWIVKDNTFMLLDAYQVIELGKTAAEWERVHVLAARALKDMDPIPEDYIDDKYWP